MTYEMVASEYFDYELHPTCRAFGIASRRLIEEFAVSRKEVFDTIVEIGPGEAPAAELFSSQNCYYFDYSSTMLDYAPARPNTTKVLAPADRLPLEVASVDLLLASLGDPYNTELFWFEASRVMRPGGICVFTTPSFEWSSNYRSIEKSPKDRARFIMSDGGVFDLPSFVLAKSNQIELFHKANFELVEAQELKRNRIPDFVAPKLDMVDNECAIVVLYIVRRRFS